MVSIKDRVRDFSLANIQKTAQQLIQGAGYQSPDYLTDKTKVLARKAYVSPAPNRLKANVQNLSQPLQTRILKPQAQEVETNAFNQALASRGGQNAVQAVAGFSRGATTLARILPPVNKLSAKAESVTPEATTFDQKIARLGGAMAGGAANVMALGANPILTATSTGLGAVMGGASSALTDGDVSKGAYRGALRGAEDSPAYALTSAVVGKLAKGIGALKPLTDENITPIAGKTIRGVAGSAVKNLFARSARATLLETPYEALFYGIRDKEEKERLIDSITDEWWTNLVFNNAFAAVNTGQDVLSKQGRQAVMQALENSPTYKQTLGNDKGFIAFRGDFNSPKVEGGSAGPGKYYSLSKDILKQEGVENIKASDIDFKNPLEIKDSNQSFEIEKQVADSGYKSLTEWAASKGHDGVIIKDLDQAIDIRGLGAKADVSDPLEALKTEAKKYKSADEFDAELYRTGRDISSELKTIYPDKNYFNALDSLVKGKVEKPAIDYATNGVKVFHGSDNKFTKIDPAKSNLGSKTGVGKGHIFYSTDKEIAGSYGKNVLEETIKPQNPLVVNADGLPWNDIKFEGKSLNINELAKLAEERGYGSLVVERVRDTGGKQARGVPGGFKESTTIALFDNGNQAQATKGVEGTGAKIETSGKIPTRQTVKTLQTPQESLAAADQSLQLSEKGRAGISPYDNVDVTTKTEAKIPTRPKATDIANQQPGTVEQTLRLDKLNVDEASAKVITDVQKELGLDTRDVRSFEDMRQLAGELGTTPEKLLKEIQTNRITDAEVIALGDVISTSSKRIAALSNQLTQNPDNATIKAQLQAEEGIMANALKKRIRAGTEAGRAVVAYKQIANNTMEPAYWLDKAQRQLGDTRNLRGDEVAAIQEMIQGNDRLGLARFVSLLGESDFSEKAITLWKAGLLSNPTTHLRNIISNVSFGVLETVKDIPASVFDWVRATVTGGERTKAFTLKEVPESLEGFGEGMEIAKKYLSEGIDPIEANKAEIYSPTRYGDTQAGKAVQKYTDFIFRTLGAEDKPFRQAAFQRSLSEQVVVKGINEGLTLDQMDDLMKKPTQEMLDIALQDGLYATFNKQNRLADAVRGFGESGGEGVRVATEIVAPFKRTPANVGEALFDYSPAGFVQDAVKRIIKGDAVSDRQLADAFGRSVVGTAIVWAGVQLAKAGNLIGTTPTSSTERSQMYLEGKQPNAIFVNGKWRSLGAISPFGNLLIIGAEYVKNGGDLLATAGGGVKSVTEQTFLRGVAGGLKAITEPDRYAASFVENAVAGIVPSLFAGLARGTDRVMREPDSALDRIKVRIPFARHTIPARIDALGQTVSEQGGLVGALFDPFNSKKATDDPLVREFERIGYNLGEIGNTLDGKKLTREEKQAYQIMAGRYIREYLPTLIKSSTYQAASTDIQKDMVDTLVRQSKARAREEFKQGINLPDINATIISDADAAESMGLPSGVTLNANVQFYQKKDGTLGKIVIESKPANKNGTAYAKWETEAYKNARTILNNAASDDEKSELIQQLGLNRADVEYYDIASEENRIKYIYVRESLQGVQNRQELLERLVSMRKEVNGSMILAQGVVDELYNEGLITKNERDQLKNLKLDSEGNVTVKPKMTGRGGSAKLKRFKYVPMKAPKAKAIKLSKANQLSSPQKYQPIKVKMPEMRIPTPQVASDQKYQVKFNL